jgi:hypothetical protein
MEWLLINEAQGLKILLKENTQEKSTSCNSRKKEILNSNSSDGDDHDPPKKNLERPHKLTINSKIKRQVNQQEVAEVILDDEDALEDMELDENIEDIKFPDKEKRI